MLPVHTRVGEAEAASQVEDGDNRTVEIDHTESHRRSLGERRHRDHGQHTLHHRKRQSVLLLCEEEDDQVESGRRQVSIPRGCSGHSPLNTASTRTDTPINLITRTRVVFVGSQPCFS